MLTVASVGEEGGDEIQGQRVGNGARCWCHQAGRPVAAETVQALTRVPVYPFQHWVTSRQMRFEGGFQGRCNKLVDGCYSFWQAGLLPLLHRALHAKGEFGACVLL